MRRLVIENALHAIPLEVHGGKEYLEVGLKMARQALLDGRSLLIFPEGAYTGDAQVTKGRTGASRILFEARIGGGETQLIASRNSLQTMAYRPRRIYASGRAD